jgi:transketolase
MLFDFRPHVLRRTVIDMAYAGSTAHIGCAFSIIEILSVLHQHFLRFPDNDPDHAHRDLLVLSKGHGVMAQYACMHARGWLSKRDIENYFADGTELKGLSDSRVSGLEVTSGSLGHGFSVGVGMAFAERLKKSDIKVFAVLGDGEINEGAIWEAALFAAHHGLSNLITIVDENGFQAMGATQDVLALGSIAEKFNAFGFEVLGVDGHDQQALRDGLKHLLSTESERPKLMVAKTVKGKGVSFMENDNRWHYLRLDASSYQLAVAELSRGSA